MNILFLLGVLRGGDHRGQALGQDDKTLRGPNILSVLTSPDSHT